MNGPAVVVAWGLTLIRATDGGHRIELRDGGALVACLESIEACAADAADGTKGDWAHWPASPPVQEWHDEKRGDAVVLMALGRAGRSHWSISCEVTPDGAARFDVAARISEPPERLGSCYRLTFGEVQQATTEGLQINGGWELIVDAATTRLRYDVATRNVKIAPTTPLTAAWPQTLRWGYQLRKRV